MPNMNGYELLDKLRSDKKTQLIPIILLSAKACEDSKVRGLDKGADDYLTKPFSALELITRIRTNIELSFTRRKILFQRYEQEITKQLILSLTNKIHSKLNLNETLQYVIKEIRQRVQCDRIFIISNEKSESMNNNIVVLYDDSENITPIINPFADIRFNNKTIEIKSNKDFSGWIKLHRSPNSIWLDSEIEFLQEISNQIGLAITYAKLNKENDEKEIQIKAAKIANNVKSQILANTSHELRTPLGSIVGILSFFECTNLSVSQKDMIKITECASDTILSIVNDILDAAKLEAHKVTLKNRTFNLIELFEHTIDEFGKKAADKNLDLIVNYDINNLPRYIKSDPERLKQVLSHLLSNSVKFTNVGKIILKISSQTRDPTYGKMFIKENLLIELFDTGIGMSPKFIQDAWKSFSLGDMSVTRKHDGTGLGLSICKSLVEINGGEINVDSQLGKGSKFWFTWNIETLSIIRSIKFDDQINNFIRISIIHPIEDISNVMLKYLKMIKKIDKFDTFDKCFDAIKIYKQLHNRFAYDIAFIGLYKYNEEEVLNAALELRRLEINSTNLVIIFIVFPNDKGNELAKKLIEKVGGATSILYTPITMKKLVNQFKLIKKNRFY
ncbi:9081_t:CDS:2 [Scutellospora calospora]|uniref:9081_t:CDS:1 n=1 Tax=Scutellospora calospora TaxID=85575 RepID=A0ACA9KDD0_9GLOM|nr:9081_t:CDS:2 [Scutellospora calospora]